MCATRQCPGKHDNTTAGQQNNGTTEHVDMTPTAASGNGNGNKRRDASLQSIRHRNVCAGVDSGYSYNNYSNSL
ncbi:hypothetical protein ACLKA7_009724 [Drosophila subpalustris]